MNSRTQEVKKSRSREVEKSRSREVEKSRRTSSLVPRSASQHSRVLESLSSSVLEFFAPMSVDHDLLSTAKISTVVHARKDAKTTNSSSLGAKAGGRRRTSITRCFQAGYQGPVEAHAQSRSQSVKALPAADRPVAWMDRINRAHWPVISCLF